MAHFRTGTLLNRHASGVPPVAGPHEPARADESLGADHRQFRPSDRVVWNGRYGAVSHGIAGRSASRPTDRQPPRQILAAWLLGILPAGPSHEAVRQRVLFEALDWPQDEVSFGLSSSLLGWGSLSVLAWGDRDRAEDLWGQVEAMAQRTKEPRVIHLALVCRFLAPWRTVG